MAIKKAATKKTAVKKTPVADTASDAVDEQLARYRSMRDFGVTAEPAGKTKTGTKASLPFCIQKHAASHLHYDFRLGWNGVLKSWACAKGPSYNVKDKRLAVQVEDHPIEYGGFEGIIPAGQYGGGTVMLWDQGTWEPQEGHTDVDAGLRDGNLKFVMHGTKMKGKWALIRMGGKAAQEKKPNWLLIKEHDEFERPPEAPAAVDEENLSVVTGRSMEQIAGSEDHVWNSKDTQSGPKAWYRQDAKAGSAEELVEDAKPEAGAAKEGVPQRLKPRGAGVGDGTAEAVPLSGKGVSGSASKAGRSGAAVLSDGGGAFRTLTKGLPKEAQPGFIKPQLAQQAETAPDGDGWLHELKLDGYRMQARKAGSKVQMLTRSGLDWTARIPSVAAAVAALPFENVTLDGEVVVLAEDGTTNFADLQASFQDGAKNPLTYFVFDLLHIDGKNPRGLALRERKALVAEVLAGAAPESLQVSEHLESGGQVMFEKACELGAEGIISKKASGKYVEGRSADWLKLKCLHEQEFVVGGFTLPSNGSAGIGALLLGYYAGKKLVYAGRTGTGFTQRSSKTIRTQLEGLKVKETAFEKPPGEARRGAIWVRPELVAQVRFATWTAENQLRQAAFLGLREDKAASEVVKETAGPTPKRAKGASLPRASASHQAPVVRAAMVLEKATVRLTHPEKVLDASTGVTKEMLADYLWTAAPRILPHIASRPLSLVRLPDGVGGEQFFQKHVTKMLPKGVGCVDVPNKKTGMLESYITVDNREALASLAQMSTMEIHPWGSQNDDLERPDRLVIDLDPDESLSWGTVCDAAVSVRDFLGELGLESFVKTTGGKGLHVVFAVEPELEWGTIKEFAHGVVNRMEKQNPALYLTKMTKAARVGKIYLDYLRNERGATAVAPYSTRARAGVGVAVPLDWSELGGKERPVFRLADFSAWSGRLKDDPWAGLGKMRQRVTAKALAAVGVKASA